MVRLKDDISFLHQNSTEAQIQKNKCSTQDEKRKKIKAFLSFFCNENNNTHVLK